MCYNCGCSLPEDDMGHSDNITNTTFSAVGTSLGKSQKEIQEDILSWLSGGDIAENEKETFHAIFEKSAKAWGQSIDEAKKNTLLLLKDQLGK